MIIREIMFKVFILVFIGSCAGSENQLQNNGSQDKVAITLAVMPFIFQENFPYSNDLIRRDVELVFFKRDCEILTPEEWGNDFSEKLNLINLNLDECDSIARLLNVDMIITGDFNTNVRSERGVGLFSSRTIYKPLILKAYSSKLKDFVLVKREKAIERWGLFQSTSQDFVYRLSEEFAQELVSMGFINE